MPVEKIDLSCPQCGGNMERDTERQMLHCPYCGHEVMLQHNDAASIKEKAYARQQGILQANAEAEKKKKLSKVKVGLIIVGVIFAFIAAAMVYNALQPKVNPFDYIAVEFSGTTGDGTAEIVYLPTENDEVNPREISYRLSERAYLSEGDTVTVTASSSTYNLSPTSKAYKVKGLDTYLAELNAISDKAVEMIHNKSDMTVDMATDGLGISLRPTSTTPCVMYLTTDGKSGNTLYDIYKAVYPEKDGSTADRYIVVYYTNIVIRDTAEPTMSYDSTMYTGQIIETLDKGYGGYVTGYKSLKDAKADILSHQSKAVTLQEREAQP